MFDHVQYSILRLAGEARDRVISFAAMVPELSDESMGLLKSPIKRKAEALSPHSKKLKTEASSMQPTCCPLDRCDSRLSTIE